VLAVLARVHGRDLEHRLVAGEDPSGDAMLSARAAQLTAHRLRTATADSLQRVLDRARDPDGWCRSGAIPALRDEVLIAEPALVILIGRLRDRYPVWPVGVARARRLLADRDGPLHSLSEPGELRRCAHVALAELDDGRA
jgi:hypothetical protein